MGKWILRACSLARHQMWPSSLMVSYEEMERNARIKLYSHRIARHGMATLGISPECMT